MKAIHFSEGSNVIYTGDLPDDEGWGSKGYIVALTPDASGDKIATVDFNGHHQDIPLSDLELDPMDAQHHFDGDDCTGTEVPGETVTDEQIEALEREAGQAGDLEMARVCDVALGRDVTDAPGVTPEIAAMSRDEARAECARVIADAKAMQED